MQIFLNQIKIQTLSKNLGFDLNLLRVCTWHKSFGLPLKRYDALTSNLRPYIPICLQQHMVFTTVWQLCSEKGRVHTAWQILLEVLGYSHWQIWGAAKVTAGYRFHIFSLDCNLTKRRAGKLSTADRNKLWSCKAVAQHVNMNCQGIWFLALLSHYVVMFIPGTPQNKSA